MTISDWVQLGMLGVVGLTLLVLLWQVVIQNRLAKAQILRDRFEMYWQTYSPVTDAHIAELRLAPDEYVPLEKYETEYSKSEAAIRKLIGMGMLYEYLAFLHTLRAMRVPDPLGQEWLAIWTADLAKHKEFRDVHEHWRDYYPAYAAFVDAIVKNAERHG